MSASQDGKLIVWDSYSTNKASKRDFLFHLGFPNKTINDISCVTLDVTSLLQDKEMSFSPEENKDILAATLEQIFNKSDLCKIGHAMFPGVAALKNHLGIDFGVQLGTHVEAYNGWV